MMATTQNSASNAHNANVGVSKVGRGGPGFTWGVLLPLVVVLIILVTWLAKSYVDDEEPIDPIASLDAPDYHSLLFDPQVSDRILFGSHAGIQESLDGGWTWQAGSLRNVDAMQLNANPNAPTTIYATGHDGFLMSRDGGRTWPPKTHSLPGMDIHAFAQDSTDPARLYAFVVGTGTLTSEDGGTTWGLLPSQPPGGEIHVVLTASRGVLYAASGSGLATTTDAGATWKLLPSRPSGQVISLVAAASDAQLLYAGTPNGLVKSSDGGATWNELGPVAVPVLAIAVNPSDANHVLALSNEGDLFRTDDGGESWNS